MLVIEIAKLKCGKTSFQLEEFFCGIYSNTIIFKSTTEQLEFQKFQMK